MFNAMFEAFLPFDGAVAQWFATTFDPGANPFWDKFFSIITTLGDGGVFWIIIAVALMLFNKTRKAGFVMAVALLLNVLVTNAILKPMFDRPRPYHIDFIQWAKDYIYPNLTHMPGDKSFPSGHTSICVAGALGLFFGLRPAWLGSKKPRNWAWTGIVLAALVGVSRIYLGVHYTTDVLGGVLVGVLTGLAALYLIIWLEKPVDRLDGKISAFVDRRFPKIFRTRA